MNLTNPKISYIVLSSNKIEDMISILYAKDYKIIPIKGYYKGNYEDSALAYSDIDNDELRKDLIFLLNHFKQDCGIIKYLDETVAKKIFSDGSEKPLGIVMYNTDSENKSFLYNGISFSFVEQKRYWFPKSEKDFKVGMIVEYNNKNKWFSKKVENPEQEYNKMYKLLIKYNKIRVQSIL
jgi:hypothetical protein